LKEIRREKVIEARRVKVCFVAPKAYPLFEPAVKEVFGGAEVDLYYLATELAKDDNFEVSFITADYDQGASETRRGIKIIKSLKFCENSVKGAVKIWRAMKGAGADIYMLKTASAGVPLAAVFCKINQKTFVYRTAHEQECNGNYINDHPLMGLVFKLSLKTAKYVFSQNKMDQQNLKQTTGVSSIFIRNGHQLCNLTDSKKDTILWVARSSSFKNPYLFIKLAEQLPQENFTMICQRAIEDKNYNALVSEAKKLSNLEFVQQVAFSDIGKFFQRAKVLVNTSDGEGFPNTFIQAGKYGAAVLSLNVNPDAILDKYKCGICAGGDWERFVDSLRSMLENDKYIEMGKMGRKYVEENHDISKIINQYKGMFAKASAASGKTLINWRKPLIYIASSVQGSPAAGHLRYLKSAEQKTPEQLQQMQDSALRKLLEHAYKNVPYYNRVLTDGALDNFHKIPILTKEIMRREGDNLYSKDHTKRHSYINTSGGSTGEPVKFMQDKNYDAWSLAGRFLYNFWACKDVGEREIKLWGSERDVLERAEKISTRLRRWGFNVLILNSFAMSNEIMGQYVKRWNKFRPKLIWAYTGSIFEFAKYIERSGVEIFRPGSIICTAETLTEQVREYVEGIFRCPLLNQYGSREVGIVACECPQKEGLHVLSLHNKIEILDDNFEPCKPGEMGKVYATTLNNYSMPLIRYDIGDMAIAAENELCSCGRSWPLIKNVIGRYIEAFKTKDGRTVPAEFFIHFIGVVYNKDCIRKFQVLQRDYDYVVIKLVVTDNRKFEELRTDLICSIRRVMGQDCKVEFEYVDDILPSKSGKYLYTISEIA